jgi:4-nitrophenyl phosphatase
MHALPSDVLGLILDMDGVLWRDADPIGNLRGIFERIAAIELGVVLCTNNSTRTPEQYLEKLGSFGVALAPWQIVTSSGALAHALSRIYPEGGKVFVLGEVGLTEALRQMNFEPVTELGGARPIAVAMGMDRQVTFEKLRAATLLIRGGVPFYATNPDRTFPTPEGLIPGAGALMAALVTATDVQPTVVGKPRPGMLELALDRLGLPRERTLVVGDRLETDIAAGQAVGCRTALVLSGVSTRPMASAWQPPVDIIAADLGELVGS